jgi:hypothetical protein
MDPKLMATFDTTVARGAAITIWLASTACLWPLYAWLPPNPDQEMFDAIGLYGSWGGKYYVDSADHNWPGAMLLHELATRLLGVHIWSFRVLDFAVMTIAALALSYLLRRSGKALAAWIVLPLYQLMYITSGAWFAGQRDIIAANILLVAVAVASYAVRTNQRYFLVVVGALTAFATLMRPTFLAYMAYLSGLLIVVALGTTGNFRRKISEGLLSTTWLSSGVIVTLLIPIAFGLASQNIKPWYEHAVLFNVYLAFETREHSYFDIIVRFSEFWRSWHWYLAYSALGLFAWIARDRVNFELLAAVGVAIIGLLSAFVQKAGFGYHLGALLPILALLTAVWLGDVISAFVKSPKNVLAAGSAAIFCGIAVLGLSSKATTLLPQAQAILTGDFDLALRSARSGDNSPYYITQTANFIRTNTQANDRVLVWSRHTHIQYLSERRSPTHFTNIGLVSVVDARFSLANAWFDQFERELGDNISEFIVVHTARTSDSFDRFHSSDGVNRAVLLVRNLVATQYEKATEFGPFVIYGRIRTTPNPDAPGQAPK